MKLIDKLFAYTWLTVAAIICFLAILALVGNCCAK